MDKKSYKNLNFVEFRLNHDWSNLKNEKYSLENFTVSLEQPQKCGSGYIVFALIKSQNTLYNDKPYQVFSLCFINLFYSLHFHF